MYTEERKEISPPEYMPKRKPDFTSNKEVLTYKPIPGITFHDKDDGILYYYDQPLLYIAYIEDQMVMVGLLDEDWIARSGGWAQYIAIPTTLELAQQIYNSERPVRDFWDQESNKNWFIHKDWTTQMLDNKRVWDEHYKIYKNIKVLEKWKPKKDVTLNPNA